jgi:ABC-type Na+ transport system ATPase subunit NatA
VALAEVSLAVEKATVLALLGPNGAGKTTLVRILTTLLKPDSGSARGAGHDTQRAAAAVRSAIGLAGQYAAVDELLTARENLELVGLWYHLPRSEYRRRAVDLLDRFTLTDVADRLVKTYSGGMRRRLDIAASLIGRPRVLFLDEPTTGLDPRTRNDVWASLQELVNERTTVLLTTQHMGQAEHVNGVGWRVWNTGIRSALTLLYGLWAGRAVSARTLRRFDPLIAPGVSSLLAWAEGSVQPADLDALAAPGSQQLVLGFRPVPGGAVLAI